MSADERQHRSPDLSDEEWLVLLSSGEVEIEGRLPWSSNYSFLVTVSGSRPGPEGAEEAVSGRAVYKPGRGERPLWDFGENLYRREVAAYELSAALGLSLVPETVLRLDGPLGPGSLQRFIEADFEQHYFTLLGERRFHPRLKELAGFDVLANNADRKAGHVLLDGEEHIWGIDNGLSFHQDVKLRTVIWDFAGEEIPAVVLEACETVAERGAPETVRELIDDDEDAALVARARAMLRHRRLPAPRDDHRSYPWPLV